MITCFQFDFIYFVQFNLHLIGRKVNLQAVISKRVKFDKKSSFTFSFDFFVQFGEFVQLDVACPMKPKQTTQTYALSSTASEARSINLERQGHRSGRSPRPDGPWRRVDRLRRLKKSKAVANPVFHPSLPPRPHQHQPGYSLRSSTAVSPSLLPA